MSWTRRLFGLAVVSMALAVVFAGTKTAEMKPVQDDQKRQAGVASMVATVPVEATLQVKSGKLPLKGRVSVLLEVSPAALKRGAITVRQFNLVFPDAPQAAITGKRQNPTGPLGMSIRPSENAQLKYDSKSQTASGEIPVQAHFPQLDELFPPEFVKDDRESDFAVSRTQRGLLKLELRFAEPPDKALERATKAKAANLVATGSAGIELEPIRDRGISVPGYRVDLQVRWPFEIGPILWFEVANRLCLQPVRIRSSASDPSPTGLGLAFGMPGANTQWNKADVVFTVRSWMTVTNSALKVATGGAEEDSIRASVNVGDCIEVFFVENFSPVSLHGGGATWSSGTANAKIISSDGNATFGVDLTHLAHEIGHVIFMGHPGNPFGLFDPSTNTLMCPSGWHNDNPKRNSRDNALNVANPLFTFALKSISAGTDCNSSGDCGACP